MFGKLKLFKLLAISGGHFEAVQDFNDYGFLVWYASNLGLITLNGAGVIMTNVYIASEKIFVHWSVEWNP